MFRFACLVKAEGVDEPMWDAGPSGRYASADDTKKAAEAHYALSLLIKTAPSSTQVHIKMLEFAVKSLKPVPVTTTCFRPANPQHHPNPVPAYLDERPRPRNRKGAD